MSEAIREVSYFSELDKSMQLAFFAPASGTEKRPVVVALHTWSADHHQDSSNYFSRCAERNWHCIFPRFRGPNWQTEACGSDLVVSDIAGALAYVKANYPVDEERIYLVGGSGGGHASLLLAGRHPELWSAVSAWCPISDVAKWHASCRICGRKDVSIYADHIEQACGGDPQKDPQVFADAMKRSPVTYLPDARGKLIVDISTGIHDGHTGSVPVSQALEAFNILAAEDDRLSDDEIDFIVKNQAIPAGMEYLDEDPVFGDYKVLFRRESGLVRITLFEGSHNLLCDPAMAFLGKQQLGKAPDWSKSDAVMAGDGELGR